MVQKIRTQYTERENTQLDTLKALDKKVKKPANVFAVVFGSISAVIMGSGMSLVLTDLGVVLGLGDFMILIIGIVVGVIGMFLMALAYPIYIKVLKKERERIAPEILKLTEELLR
jgi:hypothetical protein